MKIAQLFSILLVLIAFVLGMVVSTAQADDPASSETYLLRYKLKEGQRLQTQVEQMAKVTTKIDRREEIVQTHSDSVKQWKVVEVKDNGDMVFEHAVLRVSMYQKADIYVEGEKPEKSEISFQSDDEEAIVPEAYVPVAQSVKKILATITINGQGQLVGREDHLRQYNSGWGDLLVPLPEKEVTIGYQWASPREIPIKLQDDTFKQIKTRQLYTLVSVKHGVATIRSKTQLLSPVNDPRIQSQLVQKFTDGEIKFDVDAGCILSKQIDLDEDIVGFSGAGSRMIYVARLSEKLLDKAEMLPDTSEYLEVTGIPEPPGPTYGPEAGPTQSVAEEPGGSTIKK